MLWFDHSTIYICSFYRLDDFADKERMKVEREAAYHSIESLVYDLAYKLEQSEYLVL